MLVLALSAASGWLGSATRPINPVQRAAVLRRTSAVVLSTPDVKAQPLRNATVDLIDQLAQSNPTPAPFAGFREAGGGNKLSGSWKLLFTTGADATVRPSKDKGTATVYQVLRRRRRRPPPAATHRPPRQAPSAAAPPPS